MPPTLSAVQQLAPDQASLQAAAGQLKPSKWPLLGHAADRDLAWGECQGSGSSPYRVCASLDDLGFKCTCPSRKQPCKHSLALLWIAADRGAMLADAAVPDWVEDWVSRRRKRSSGPTAARAADDTKDIAAVVAVDPVEDAKKAAAAAKAAEKRREDREAAIRDGLDDLERWLGDVLGDGTGAFPARAVERCRKIAARLVDAKAPALATRLDELPSALFAIDEDARGAWLQGELGRIALLVRAYRRQDALPPALRDEVRRLIGWTTLRDALVEDPTAPRVVDAWTVLGARVVPQSDRLIRHETWLRRHDGPEFALLLDFVPPAGGTAPTWRAGETIAAELVFYPSPTPLRAQVLRREADPPASPPAAALAVAHDGLDAALSDVQRLVAKNPWLTPAPIVVRGARVGRIGERVVVTTDDGAFLPVVNEVDVAFVAMAATGPVTAAMLVEDAGARLLAADTAVGFWSAS